MKCEHTGQTYYSLVYGAHDSHTEYLIVKDVNDINRYVKEWDRVVVVQLPHEMEPHQIWKWIQDDPESLSRFMDIDQYITRMTEIGKYMTNN